MAFDLNLFEKNFDFGFKATVANNLIIATKAFDEFWMNNLNFLRDADDLYGRILSYAVNQQFKNAATKSASSYLVRDLQVNRYKNRAVLLNTDDYITSICRTEKPKSLPPKAKYKLELAEGNRDDYNQMELHFIQDQISVKDKKKYAIIGYRYINKEMKHLNIIVPDHRFQSIIYSESLLGNITEYNQYVPEELIYDQVADLKNDLIVKLREKKIGNGD